MELAPGIYNVAAAIGLSGNLTLTPDVDDLTKEWFFNIGGTLSTAAFSKMIMFDEGRPANVHWDVVGAITLGSDSVAVGDMKAGGAFTLGTGTIFTFDSKTVAVEWTFTIGGALTTEAFSEMIMVDSGSRVIWNVDGAITLGAASKAIGNMKSRYGAITVGAAATCENLEAPFGAITLGAGANAGTLMAGGAITLVAGARSGTVSAGGACTGSGCPLP
jgi:hypothetical protein